MTFELKVAGAPESDYITFNVYPGYRWSDVVGELLQAIPKDEFESGYPVALTVTPASGGKARTMTVSVVIDDLDRNAIMKKAVAK